MKKLIKKMLLSLLICFCAISIAGCDNKEVSLGKYELESIKMYEGEELKSYNNWSELPDPEEGMGYSGYGIESVELKDDEKIIINFIDDGLSETPESIDVLYKIEDNKVFIRETINEKWPVYPTFSIKDNMLQIGEGNEGVFFKNPNVSDKNGSFALFENVENFKFNKNLLACIGISFLISSIICLWFIQFASRRNGMETGKSAWGWIGTSILMVIPVVSIIMLFVWAFGEKTRNDYTFRSWAKLNLIAILFAVLFEIVLLITINVMGVNVLQ